MVIPLAMGIFAIFRFPADSYRVSLQVLCEIATVLAFAYLLWVINKWMAMFGLLVCFSSIFPQYDRATFLSAHAVFYGMVWYYTVCKIGTTTPILNMMCVIALMNVLFLCLQLFNLDPFFKPIQGGYSLNVGLMTNPNGSSALLAMCFPAFLRGNWMYAIPFVIVGLILAKSFGGVLAIIVGTAYYLWKRTTSPIIILYIIATISVFLFVDSPGIKHRYDTWAVGLEIFLEHWVFGSGIGHWKYVFTDIIINDSPKRMLQAHNEYVQGLFELGVLFVFILCGFAIATINKLRCIDDIFAVAMLIIAVNCFVNFPLHIAVTAYIVLTWIALIDRSYYEKNELRSYEI